MVHRLEARRGVLSGQRQRPAVRGRHRERRGEVGHNGRVSGFDPRPYLKEIARGRHGARDLTREQSRTLWEAVFAGAVEDLALGALLVGWRIKGETHEELAGMME